MMEDLLAPLTQKSSVIGFGSLFLQSRHELDSAIPEPLYEKMLPGSRFTATR